MANKRTLPSLTSPLGDWCIYAAAAEREIARLQALCACPWCGCKEQRTDQRGTCAKCGLPWQFKDWLPGVDKLPEGGGESRSTDHAEEAAADPARQSGTPEVDPSGVRLAELLGVQHPVRLRIPSPLTLEERRQVLFGNCDVTHVAAVDEPSPDPNCRIYGSACTISGYCECAEPEMGSRSGAACCGKCGGDLRAFRGKGGGWTPEAELEARRRDQAEEGKP